MDKEEKLELLKQDLQRKTKANDEYLKTLLELAEKRIQREGIVLEEKDIEIQMAVVQYAAYLFRKRDAPDTSMPRYLRKSLNDILFSQKGKAYDV